MSKTIFSQIVDREIPAHILYEDEHTLAFLDIQPLTEGHTLVISKEPYDHIDDCPPELYAAIFSTVQKVSKLLRQRLDPIRVGLVVHGFEVPHAHVHVLPMYTGSELKLADRENESFKGDLAETAKKLYS
jgi:histidine triad (HIT) family protein